MLGLLRLLTIGRAAGEPRVADALPVALAAAPGREGKTPGQPEADTGNVTLAGSVPLPVAVAPASVESSAGLNVAACTGKHTVLCHRHWSSLLAYR